MILIGVYYYLHFINEVVRLRNVRSDMAKAIHMILERGLEIRVLLPSKLNLIVLTVVELL